MTESNHNVTVLDAPARTQANPAPSPGQKERAAPEGWGTWLLRTAPTCLVLAALAGIGWWGHQSGWTVHKFSEMFGGGQVAKDDWCKDHPVPETECVECNEKAFPRPQDHGFCRVHGVHNCPFEHTDVIQTHDASKLTKDDLERAQRALTLKPRAENSPKCKLYHRRIQFASVEVLNKMGVDIHVVDRGAIEESISASGEITFAPPNVGPVHTNVAGRVFRVTESGQLGATVKKGDILALVDAVEVGKAKAELLQACAQMELKNKTMEQLRVLAPSGAVADVRVREAEAALQEAKIRLVAAEHSLLNLGVPVRAGSLKGMATDELASRVYYLGLPHEALKTFDASMPVGNLLTVRAPRDGIVTASKVVSGETVDPTKPLFVVADTSQMWLTLHVRPDDRKFLKDRDGKTGSPGLSIRFRPDGSDEDVLGEIVWISKAVDDKTRTIQVRADLPNPDGKLLAHTFGTGKIILRQEKDAIIVPSADVHWEGDCHVVFVRDKDFHKTGAPKVYHTRSVRPGVKHGEYTEIIAGLAPGEVIAARNSSALRAELLKNRLGDG